MDSVAVFSIILPVYNGADYLRPAIDSILKQTFQDFEFVIINDGSSDNSAEVIRSYADPRIRYLEQDNQGLSATLNRGIREARGKWIARQDQDDISHPERLKLQYDFLRRNPSHVLLGTWARIISQAGTPQNRIHSHPVSDQALRVFLCRNNPFVHSSVVFLKEAAVKAGLYSTDKSRQPPEDYEFWSRLATHGKIANIPRILLDYREVATSMSRTGINPFLEKVIQISSENLMRYSALSGVDYNFTAMAKILNGVQQDPMTMAQVNSVLTALKRVLHVAALSEANRELLLIRRLLCRGEISLTAKFILMLWRIHNKIYRLSA